MQFTIMESFEDEALKYKSAEDFIKAQKPVYHGCANEEINVNIEQPMFVSLSKDIAKYYAGMDENDLWATGNGVVLELFLDSSATSINIEAEQYMTYLYGKGWKKKWERDMGLDDPSEEKTKITNNKLITMAKNKGVDIIIIKGDYEGTPLKDLDEDQYLIVNHNVLKTKPQLIDIWRKANEV